MSNDATFQEGRESPLRLLAADADDLQVVATLTQDAVFPMSEMKWDPAQRTFAILLNRFRWEDAPGAKRRERAFERVQSVISFGDVTHVASQGIDRSERETVLSLLSLSFEPADAPAGRIVLTLAGDGAVALDVDCIDVLLSDVTRPYAAPSGKAPQHPE